MTRRVVAIAALLCLHGCFGYNHGAKAWSYVGDSILIVGGGGAIAADVTTRPGPCMGTGCPTYTEPFGGGMVAGVVLVTAGLIGIVINATRPTVKTSR
jgi:hypothetical protein